LEDETEIPVFDPSSSSEEPTLPDLPAVKATKQTVEPVSPPTVKAVAPPVVKEVKPPTVEVVSDTPSSDYLQRKEAQFGSMPRRPVGLPKAAVFDIELNTWTLFGRPVEASQMSTIVSTKPSRSNASTPAVQTKARNAPTLPSIPTPPKKEKKRGPRLPNIPQI
jgi:hypothetical protein